jgi:cytochrome d ubiquinol oxidase subunit II
MSVLAFVLLTAMLSIYVLTDGYDLGVAAVTPLVARNDRERAASMQSIGPFWSGNEVWLIAAGGVLFAAFPKAYASAFSGFYLPFMLVLWLLMFRGVAIELRGHLGNRIWREFWDTAFSVSSTLLIVVFGVAIGNLVRGLPLNAAGYFRGTFALLLNPYALGVGVLALLTLAQHGLAFLVLRIDGPPAERARKLVGTLRPWLATVYLVVTITTFAVRPGRFDHGISALIVPCIALGLLWLTRSMIARERHAWAFAASCGFITCLLVAAAATMYPYLLPAYPPGSGGLDITAASPSPTALTTVLTVTLIGLVGVAYSIALVARRMRGKITIPPATPH